MPSSTAVKRRLVIVVGVLFIAGAGVLGQSYLRSQVRTLSAQMYQPLASEGRPAPPGLLDDPIFRNLPPPENPLSTGRYSEIPPAVSPTPTSQPPPVAAPVVVPEQPKHEATEATKRPTSPDHTPVSTSHEPEAALQPAAVQPISRDASQADQSQVVPRAPQQRKTEAPLPTGIESVSANPEQKKPPASRVPPAASAPVARTPPANSGSFEARLNGNQKIHILLIGNDEPVLGMGRADVLLTLTLDPVHRKLTFMSVPRDTRAMIPGQGLRKINAAYAHAGVNGQMQAVERFWGIPFDKYVEISLNGFKQAIDAVGGVDVVSPQDFEETGEVFHKGAMHLNGAQALAYTRMRKDDPQGDLGRNRRQQEVMQNLIQQLGNLSPTELLKVIGTVAPYVHTDLLPNDIVQLRLKHGYVLDNQAHVSVAGRNRKIAGQWFYVVSDRERQRLHLLLR